MVILVVTIALSFVVLLAVGLMLVNMFKQEADNGDDL